MRAAPGCERGRQPRGVENGAGRRPPLALPTKLDLARPLGIPSGGDVPATLEHAQPAAGNQSHRLSESSGRYQRSSLRAKVIVGARIALRQAASSNASSASIVVAMSARSSPPAIRRGPASHASAAAGAALAWANDARHHGDRLPVGAAPDADGNSAQASPLRPEPAGSAEQQAIDDLGVVGGQLLGDAAAGRDADDLDRPATQRAACSCASSAIDIPRGSPFLLLTNLARSRFASSFRNETFIRSVRAASTPAFGERPRRTTAEVRFPSRDTEDGRSCRVPFSSSRSCLTDHIGFPGPTRSINAKLDRRLLPGNTCPGPSVAHRAEREHADADALSRLSLPPVCERLADRASDARRDEPRASRRTASRRSLRQGEGGAHAHTSA
jgi:hypothetical protein